jgi:hypothetical protein
LRGREHTRDFFLRLCNFIEPTATSSGLPEMDSGETLRESLLVYSSSFPLVAIKKKHFFEFEENEKK